MTNSMVIMITAVHLSDILTSTFASRSGCTLRPGCPQHRTRARTSPTRTVQVAVAAARAVHSSSGRIPITAISMLLIIGRNAAPPAVYGISLTMSVSMSPTKRCTTSTSRAIVRVIGVHRVRMNADIANVNVNSSATRFARVTTARAIIWMMVTARTRGAQTRLLAQVAHLSIRTRITSVTQATAIGLTIVIIVTSTTQIGIDTSASRICVCPRRSSRTSRAQAKAMQRTLPKR